MAYTYLMSMLILTALALRQSIWCSCLPLRSGSVTNLTPIVIVHFWYALSLQLHSSSYLHLDNHQVSLTKTFSRAMCLEY
ncbi:hypothetical protein DFJ58DRAFT_229526 [Suillus subalutaceus]|uniref:uncharacterized protein n=1 Tax=Suillus subalutaceus TaxID=48586 RepID=UPI001B86365A|nr:uncharacterized protein DFJ58DRAFT_229526 [Suillus subalutaceus]KAG1832909.1 hypothetical protein DFJ58DRAFT_229526 [Suillus subalutaceus]